jgi:hypothetical protein
MAQTMNEAELDALVASEVSDMRSELEPNEIAWLVPRLRKLNESLELAPHDFDFSAITLRELANLVGGDVRGDSEVVNHLLDQSIATLDRRFGGGAEFRYFLRQHGDADSVAEFDARVVAENAEADATLASFRRA